MYCVNGVFKNLIIHDLIISFRFDEKFSEIHASLSLNIKSEPKTHKTNTNWNKQIR